MSVATLSFGGSEWLNEWMWRQGSFARHDPDLLLLFVKLCVLRTDWSPCAWVKPNAWTRRRSVIYYRELIRYGRAYGCAPRRAGMQHQWESIGRVVGVHAHCTTCSASVETAKGAATSDGPRVLYIPLLCGRTVMTRALVPRPRGQSARHRSPADCIYSRIPYVGFACWFACTPPTCDLLDS